MIVLKDIEVYKVELQKLLTLATVEIHDKSIIDERLLKLSGIAFEKVVCDTLNSLSKSTGFDKEFEQSTAHSFPDLFAKVLEEKWFGVEVKTSQSDWKCFGNSIFETTKKLYYDDRIYVFFGKFSINELECRWSKYEECVDNINITHSPRYQINMDIKNRSEDSVFKKMDISYVDFSNSDAVTRMDFVRKYKRKGLGQNAALWWLPSDDKLNNDDEQKLVIQLFNELDKGKKIDIRSAAMVNFLEIYTNKTVKYNRIPTWLASQYGVVMGNIRDLFTAGGQEEILFLNKKYLLPKICVHLHQNSKQILAVLENSNSEDLSANWNLSSRVNISDFESKLNYWLSQVGNNLKDLRGMPKGFLVEDWLESLFR